MAVTDRREAKKISMDFVDFASKNKVKFFLFNYTDLDLPPAFRAMDYLRVCF